MNEQVATWRMARSDFKPPQAGLTDTYRTFRPAW